jgi:hypothetical protein
MSYDIAEWTVRVLEDGLPPLPDRLDRGQTVPVAFWRGERYGAVLFVRLWKNGQPDSDCAITERAADGSWEEPSSWGGGPWIDDPVVRSESGRDGDHVLWLGSNALGGDEPEEVLPDWVTEVASPDGVTGAEIVHVPSDMPKDEVEAMFAARDAEFGARMLEAARKADFRAILGAASMQVASIEVEHDGHTRTETIDSPAGAFVIGIEGRGPATLRALDASGATLDEEEF